MTLILHYAPDNASLCVRLALEARGIPYRTALVDRRLRGQDAPAFRAVNPHGLIPALETPDGPMFETAAILLWLADRHGGLAPSPGDPARGRVLSWLFWLSNTLHPALRILFYPEQHTDPAGEPALTARTQARVRDMLDRLEATLPGLDGWIGGDRMSVLDCYLCPMLRWLALYPEEARGWFALSDWPGVFAVAERAEAQAATRACIAAEGLGPRPFTDPVDPDPPEGSAT